MKSIRNYSLAVQIWMLLAAVSLGISLLIALLIPSTLKSFFNKEIFLTIEEAQHLMIDRGAVNQERFNQLPSQEVNPQDIRKVNHLLILPNGRILPVSKSLSPYTNIIIQDAKTQTEMSQRYSRDIEGKTVFYVIRKGYVQGKDYFIVSYMWGDYRDELVRTLFKRLLWVVLIVVLVSWIPSLLAARYLSRPLVQMKEHVRRISERDWHQPFTLERKDELGELADSIERMREKLIHQDHAQQSYLQHISHELKTPVMVIRSYAQSVQDDIYPKGDLKGSIQVIESEAMRLERKIAQLLHLTKLEYLSEMELSMQPFPLHTLVEDAVERLKWRKPEVEWDVQLDEAFITGNEEQWNIAIENVIDNQLRYARHRIVIRLTDVPGPNASGMWALRFWNDGPELEQKLQDKLFMPYTKGSHGQHGLGLMIVRRIAHIHHAEVRLQNERNGVAFTFFIPAKPPSSP
ncbi:HAMP domain-containing protein [Marinicrinis sediminis]|uniref:histidine kinase n=1 Tax=Marinicrinis sediminis TaxID=1652465 RepID=A0ABW5R829_9BACL